jgi:hypothetical protein
MNDYHNLTQRELFKKAKESCKIGDLQTLQKLTDKLMFEEYNNYGYDLLYEAGKNGHLNIVKYLFEDNYVSQYVNLPDNVNGILLECCDEYEFEIISYIITNSSIIKDNIFSKFCMDQALIASRNGHLHLLQALLTPQKDNSRIGKMLLNGGILSAASQHGHIDIVKYLLESPDLTNYRFPINYNLAFKSACSFDEMEVIKYFIFNKNINLDNDLKSYFSKNPNESVIKLFELREINQQLTSELEDNQTTNKRIKI